MIGAARKTYIALGDHALRLEPVALLALRLLVARVFWNSGLGKVDTISIFGLRLPTLDFEQATFQLFQYEFFPELSPKLANIAAVIAALGELTLPLLLAFGLMTRFGALGLLIMTAVIQIFVYPGEWWSVHAWWAASLFVILARGPGAVSLDRLFGLERTRKQT